MAGCKDSPAGRNRLRMGAPPGARARRAPPSAVPRTCSGTTGFAINTGMTKGRSDTEAGSRAGGSAPAKPGRAREERLSAALRANLARRKGQAKARGEARKDPPLVAPERDGGKPPEANRAGEGTHDSPGRVPHK